MEKFTKLIEKFFNQEFSKKNEENESGELMPVEILRLKTRDSDTELILQRQLTCAKNALLITLTVSGQIELFTVHFREVFQVRERRYKLEIIGQTVHDKLVIIRINKDRDIQVL